LDHAAKVTDNQCGRLS